MVIWKYEFPDDFRQFTMSMPGVPVILDAQMQYGRLRMWALVNPSIKKLDHKFSVYMTGEHLPENPGTYIATFQDGPFVGHVFRGH